LALIIWSKGFLLEKKKNSGKLLKESGTKSINKWNSFYKL
jgi:hypothetical protein